MATLTMPPRAASITEAFSLAPTFFQVVVRCPLSQRLEKQNSYFNGLEKQLFGQDALNLVRAIPFFEGKGGADLI